MNNKPLDKQIIKYLLISAGLVLVIIYFSGIVDSVYKLLGIMKPLAIGFVIAYVMNILMKKIEKIYFPKSKEELINKTRRPVSILLSFVIIVLALILIINIVLPQIINTMSSIVSSVPVAIENINRWISENEDRLPGIAEQIGRVDIDWNSIGKNVADYATKGITSIFTSTIGFISAISSSLFDLFVALAFAVYLLAGKEKLTAQLKRLQLAYMKKEHIQKISLWLTTANESFTSFITGQCVEAVILGTLCTIGMWIFQFPYATTVGVFVGATALIPIVGAYLGAGVGVFLIFIVDPVKAILFLVYIIVLQQLENNLIYPRVVGTSIGLPGMWVLVAIVIGGGFGGIIGMLLGVPVAATVYKLLQTATRERLAKMEPAKIKDTINKKNGND